MFGFFKKKKAPEQVSEVPYILAIADCISHNNSTVHDSLERCRNDRAAYAAQFAERFAERGIDAASCDMDTLCWIAMADELEAAHALIGVDSSSEPLRPTKAIKRRRARDIRKSTRENDK